MLIIMSSIPVFSIIDKHTMECYMIKWRPNKESKITTKSVRYGKKMTKEEAYNKMLDIRYELIMDWLEKNRGLKCVATQYE